ncbi:MAG TPA: hypothetical protein VJ063_17280 [Verrucomicrobiae bacterium]|nr:hypothetical protein [Verrucomicrobiae bacterium]
MLRSLYVIVIVLGLAFTAKADPLVPSPISRSGAPTVSASGTSYMPLLSGDRNYIVFLSSAKNLATNESFAPYLNVFRHDLMMSETKLISTGANADSVNPSVSSNGQWIAFASIADNLLPGDTNSSSDIFLANVSSGTFSLISAALDGSIPPNPAPSRNVSLSDKPQITADGRWVGFESFATNLTADSDRNNESDVFIRDTVNNQTALISVAVNGGSTASSKSEIAGMTHDGNYVLFASTATNLVINNPTNGYQELYLRDVANGTTTWILHTNTIPPDTAVPALPPFPGNVGPFSCQWASMSRNAEFVLYKVEFPSKTDARVHLYDRLMNSNTVLTTRARAGFPIHMSSDGRFIAYDETNHVFLWDRQTSTRTQISSNANSHSPVISDDGSVVTFLSGAANTPSQIYYRTISSGNIRRVTETLSGAPGTKDHYGSSITMDPRGEFILFDSSQHDLVSNDYNRAGDVFLRYLGTNQTRLISRAHQSKPAFTASGRTGITNSCLSADGNRVLFLSSDSDLVSGDVNGWPDAFVHDVQAGRTYPLTTNQDGSFGATNSVAHAILSANGRYALLGVLFPTRYEFGSGIPRASVLRKDLDTGETLTIVSNVQPVLTPFPPPVPFFGFSISADGRLVAYTINDDILVADMQTGVQTNVTAGGDLWREPLISPDGRYVLYVHVSSGQLFVSDLSTAQRHTISASYLRGAAFSQNSQFIVYETPLAQGPGIKTYSISAQTNALVCTNCRNPSTSSDARFVVYEKAVSTLRQVELKDMATGEVTPVSRSPNGTSGGNRDAISPIVSADGRFVAYTSKATNLTTDVPNGWNNLYIYDRIQGSTIRITGSRNNTGYGSGSASRPVLGPDGRTLAFQSFASDFVANDFNDTRDIFLLKLGEGDSDNDGMSDSWEQTYFSTTDRDGTGDFDQDGQTDLAEYLAGTDPTNSDSVFEVLTITSVSTGQRQLVWRAEPGKSYRVEYKSDLQAATWTSLGQVIYASEPTASALDTAAASEKRFYRVALVP